VKRWTLASLSLVLLILSAAVLAGCGTRDGLPQEAPHTAQSLAPPYSKEGTGSVEGVIADIGSNSFRAGSMTATYWGFKVYWGGPGTSQSTYFLLTPSTRVTIAGKDATGSPAAKAAALRNVLAPGMQAAVVYAMGSDSPRSPDDADYRLPVAVSVDASGPR
jgi:hypothetical protein